VTRCPMTLGNMRQNGVRALAIYCECCHHEAIMIANGFTVDLLAGLVRAGLAMATPQRMRPGDQMIEVTRLRITDAGRRALTAG
jgi:hypothetical protein